MRFARGRGLGSDATRGSRLEVCPAGGYSYYHKRAVGQQAGGAGGSESGAGKWRYSEAYFRRQVLAKDRNRRRGGGLR